MSSRFVRISLLAALVLGALVPASGAAAAFTPRLVVTPVAAAAAAALPAGAAAPAGAGVLVEVSAPATDDALARAVVHLPLGTRALAPSPGQAVGRATATALTGTGAAVPLLGTVTGLAADGATGCAPGRGALAADFSYNGATIRVPVVVADPPAAAATFAAATLTACVPAAAKPEAAGLRITGLVLGLGSAVLRTTTVPGTYRWRALVTPFAAGAADENAAAAAEAQSVLRLPQRLTASAKLTVERKPVDVKVTRTVGGKPVTAVERHVLVTRYADVRGHAQEGDAAVIGSEVVVAGGTASGSLRQLVQVAPAADGAWAVRIQIDSAAPTVYFQARLAGAVRDLGAAACTPSFGAVPCASATSPALRLATPIVSLATGR